MKPELDRVLEICAASLMADVAPHVTPSYRQATVMSAGLLLSCVREELDRIAERRVVENAALRLLFERAVPEVGDPALAQRLTAAVAEPVTDLRISTLDAANDALRALVIELHTHLESQTSEGARRLEADLWKELAASTERRRLGIGGF